MVKRPVQSHKESQEVRIKFQTSLLLGHSSFKTKAFYIIIISLKPPMEKVSLPKLLICIPVIFFLKTNQSTLNILNLIQKYFNE